MNSSVCLGPNGTGKSTLLRTIGKMQPLLGGSVEIGGRDMYQPEQSRIGDSVERGADRPPGGWARLTAYALIGLGRYPLHRLGRRADR